MGTIESLENSLLKYIYLKTIYAQNARLFYAGEARRGRVTERAPAAAGVCPQEPRREELGRRPRTPHGLGPRRRTADKTFIRRC